MMTDHAQQDGELTTMGRLAIDTYAKLPVKQGDGVSIARIATALTQAHAAGRREGMEELGGKLDELGDSYFHLGNTQARLVIEAVENIITIATKEAGHE